MNCIKSITIVLLALLLLSTVSQEQPESNITGRVVEVEPVALDIIAPTFERVVLLLLNDESPELVELYEEAVKGIVGENPPSDTLFAFCNRTKDTSHKLDKYGPWSGIRILTRVYDHDFSVKTLTDKYFSLIFPEFYQNVIDPKLNITLPEELKEINSSQIYYILVTYKDDEMKKKVNAIYRQVYDYLFNFQTQMLAIADEQIQRPIIQVIYKGQVTAEYAASAIDELFKFGDDKVKQVEINDFIQFLNVETIDEVSELDDQSYYRIFGSALDTHILMLYQGKDKYHSEVNEVREAFKQAANQNKYEMLKYQRVLFAEASTEFLKQYFQDEVFSEAQAAEKPYKIIITKTDYSNFQLRKFEYDNKQKVTTESLLRFIEDVKMKKINPTFKSEKVPDNTGKNIKKIVGQNFISEVFEKPEKSVMVLFIDSKSEESYRELLETLQKFVQKYHEAYQQNMNVGIFDLAKNQHQSLTIKTAPELVLFEKTNKKKPKIFRGGNSIDIIKNWVNFEVKDVTIPENFGEPILPLGGATADL